MSDDRRTLTSLESEALTSVGQILNLTDGHPRDRLTPTQRTIIERVPRMFDDALRLPFSEIEQASQAAFYGAMGQVSAPIATGRMLSTYSSTIALDIVARVLAGRITDAAILHPTFDNIADLFRARGLRLHPLDEGQVDTGFWHPPSSVGAVVIVSPNNPTGWVISQEHLDELARRCKLRRQVLVMDASFRGQDARAHYDTYRTLNDSGVEWVVVEDTGKLWSVSELKAGFLSWSDSSTLDFVSAFDEIMLSVSPVILLLIEQLALDAKAGGFEEMYAYLGAQRALLADVLSGSELTLTDPQSRISVARITLPDRGPDAHYAYRSLVELGIHTLPCSRFFWHQPTEGDSQLRLSLSRPAEIVERAARALREACQRFEPQVSRSRPTNLRTSVSASAPPTSGRPPA